MPKLIRSIADAHLRSVGEDGNHIEGYPIIFGQRSVLLPDYNRWKMVYEVIEPGAVTDDLLRSSDIILNLEHNDTWMLGRMVGGEGSMTATIDAMGVKMQTTMPDTVWGKQASIGISRRDYLGMSFCYACNEDEDVTYEEEVLGDKKNLIRHVNHISGLYDFAIVAHPAYPSTSVEARSAIEDAIKRSFPEEFEEGQKLIEEQAERARQEEAMRKIMAADIDRLRKEIY